MNCSFDQCVNVAVCKTLCRAHYAQQRVGKDLKPLRRYTDNTGPEKHCFGCDTTKPRSEFYETKAGSLKPKCRPCTSKEQVERNRRARQAA